jgi:hypothetical protein
VPSEKVPPAVSLEVVPTLLRSYVVRGVVVLDLRAVMGSEGHLCGCG